ncbi:MAG: carboxypeptidase-like regulatory domain-containing protein [Candidatus Tyrphobacter sp.]
MSQSARAFNGLIFLAVSTLAACGGGGGGSSSGSGVVPGGGSTSTPGSTATPTPVATATPSTYAVSGTVTDFNLGTAVSGATVTFGSIATTNTCTGLSQCGTPVAPLKTTTTSATGAFSISGLANGTYYLQIANDANPTVTQTYTILNRSITVNGAALALGTVHITALTAQQTAWIATENNDRATLAVPATLPVVVDEYAQEDAQLLANATVADVTGGTQCSNGGDCEVEYAGQYTSYPGAIGAAGATSGQGLNPSSDYTGTQAGWWSEGAGCAPTPYDWETCTPYISAGHFINLSQDSLTFIGLAESSTPATGVGNGGYYFETIDVYAGQTKRTASARHRLTRSI